MSQSFPQIRTIDDVLPHIEGRDEFVVKSREQFIIVDYVHIESDTFDVDPENPLTGMIRRECRGMLFDKSGKLISRAFNKFFNLNEREETMLENIDFSKPHRVMTKMDGSMIRPFLLDGNVEFGSMLGLTDWGKYAENWAKNNWTVNQYDMIKEALYRNETPIFEWVSPDNRIVVQYDASEEGLYYLVSRNNLTGEYIFDQALIDNIKSARNEGVVKSPEDFVDSVRGLQTGEGVVIYFDDGMLLKLKADDYVKAHRALDLTRDDWHIAELILMEEIDDLRPVLNQEARERVDAFETKFWELFHMKVDYLYERADTLVTKYPNRVELINKVKSEVAHIDDAALVINAVDGKDMADRVHFKARWKHLSSGLKFEKLMEWLEATPK